MKVTLLLALVISLASPLPAQEPLPTPWKHQDIGAAQRPGSAKHAAGVFTLQGTMDIWGQADGCQIAYQAIHGDAELVARVIAMENPGGVAHAKAGLCIRESLDAGSRHFTLCVTPADGTQFLYRDKTNGKTVRLLADAKSLKTSVPKGQFPCWLKIVRHGDELSGYESVDGQKWQLSGKINLNLAADIVIGLTASSHKADVLLKAKFDNVKLSPQPKSSRR
jgi:hypothetical protein